MISFLPVLTVMTVIFCLSHTTGPELPIQISDIDKLLHVLAYTVLGLTALFAVRKTYQQKPLLMSIVVMVFCLLYGISDEFHQSFVPGREPSVLDVLADATGGIIAVLIWKIWHQQRRCHLGGQIKKRPAK